MGRYRRELSFTALVTRRQSWTWESALTFAAVAVLLCLGMLNVAARATWNEVEDGVLWKTQPEGVVAIEVAPDSPGARVDVRAGDVLLAIDGQPVDQLSDVIDSLHKSTQSTSLTYTLARRGEPQFLNVELERVPQGNRPLYFIMAAIGLFTLVVGASVRLKRPADPATLHFFWLCLAMFGMFTFSFSGRLDRLDWFFYWADEVSTLVLPPLFLHFTLVFPERAADWERRRLGQIFLPLVYLTATALGILRIGALMRADSNPAFFTGVVGTLDRLDPLFLAVCLVGGLAALVRSLALARSVTAHRQLRWIVWGTAVGGSPLAAYAVLHAFGFNVPPALEFLVAALSLVPLAFASAIVRYRLMDVEVIVKRSLMYAVMAAAILMIYAILLRAVGLLFQDDLHQHNTIIAMLATLVMVLLAPPVQRAIQNGLDRAFYRDRYDYRRALVRFARDLNSDLDIDWLAERLVSRIRETLLVDRMAIMLADEQAGGFGPFRAAGFADAVPGLASNSVAAARLTSGHAVALDDPRTSRTFPLSESDSWHDNGIHYFVPCVSKNRTIAVFAIGRKERGEPLSSEDVALLTAVAAQAATALENGRLYKHLQMKAQELDRLREFHENIVESLDEGLVVLDREEHVLRWNRAMAQIYGLASPDAVGQRIEEIFDPAFVEALRSARQENPAGATLYRAPLVGRGAQQGRRFLVNATTMPLQQFDQRSASESAIGSGLIMIENITARVQLEEQLQISDKMASVGLLAAGVAHEVNTPLTGISSFTQMLLDGADPEDPKTKVLEKIEQQTFRAAKIVNGLLNLSRPSQSKSEPAVVDINTIIADVLALLEHQLAIGKIKLRREFSVSPALVTGIEHRLQQVFLNLILNARDAMPRGGWLSVTTRTEGGRVIIDVADTGSGIPKEQLSRIYDPFFTTKATGKGTGLGLSITYGIVREHDGTIDCQSVMGQGTRFIVSVPLADVAASRMTGVRS
jgi:two-component system, NtrC family, sensor kinase